jgi:PadR family transcriptional regulator PadR
MTAAARSHDPADDGTFENLRLELRRGAVVIAVLARLRTEAYGYELRKSLLEQGMDIEENTLYPLLRRLEAQGLLDSEWREEDKRNKRFYRLAADGQVILARLLDERGEIEASLRRIIEENAQ